MITTQQVKEVIKELNIVSDVEALDLSINLSEQGIDSLDRTTLYFELEEKFNVKLSEEDEAKYKTIDSIVAYINGL